jgi:hypothetical protein
MRLCAELADLAMQLARAAAARTLADWAETEPPPQAEPSSIQPPGSQPTQPAQRHAHREPTPPAGPTPGHPACQTIPTAGASRQTDPAILFTRLAAIVRDCIALETRLASAPTATPDTRTKMRGADPRRVPIRETIRLSTENHPDRAEINREAAAQLDERLAADPDQTILPNEILDQICEKLGIEINHGILPDEYLDAIYGPLPKQHPDPHATYPP